MPPLSVSVACPAKVNLALSVGAPDPSQRNMHPIASWMVALRFGDGLTLTPATDGQTRFDIRFVDPPVPATVDWPLDKDLAFRAHQLLSAEVKRNLDVHVTLHKRIPPGAGLAGGSGNAAGMLVGLNRLFELGLSDESLGALAKQLGSDVIFLVSAILGRPAAIVTGFGDQLSPVSSLRPIHLVLIFPPFGCPTAAVYQMFDTMGGTSRCADATRVRALAAGQSLRAEDLFNDLAEPACRVQLEFGDMRRKLRHLLDTPIHVSGSGSTLFVIASDQADAIELAGRITTATDLATLATVTI